MMIDDHAKQSSDNSSRQNKASVEDLHNTLLHTSNPAFRSLAAMGLKGEIIPELEEQPDLKGIAETKDEQIQVTEKKAAKNKISKKAKSKRGKTKDKDKDKVRAETLSSKKKQLGKESIVVTELSQFSQWLGSLATPAIRGSDALKEALTVGDKTEGSEVGSKSDKKKKKNTTSKKGHKTKIKTKAKSKSKKENKSKKKKRSYDSGVVLSDDIFSETLADLLASQGHFRQAMHMYEKMCLIYPEKSRFFAAKIEELNKKE